MAAGVFIAFLRAINVGGHFVKMEQLRALFEELGFTEVETFINSGNVIFKSRSADATALERKIEKHLSEALGYSIPVFLRTPAELAGIAARRPFDPAAIDRALSFCVGFLKSPPELTALSKLQTETELLHVEGRELYWLSHTGQRDSKFNNTVCERALKVKSTFRSMTTVEKLAAKYR
jgi:uncharacterized protein (DUF1697 family)